MKFWLYLICLIFFPSDIWALNVEVQNVHSIFSVSQNNPFIIHDVMAKNGDIEYVFVCMDYNESEKYIGEYG